MCVSAMLTWVWVDAHQDFQAPASNLCSFSRERITPGQRPLPPSKPRQLSFFGATFDLSSMVLMLHSHEGSLHPWKFSEMA